MLPVEGGVMAVDVIVVGGGVIGCACAGELARRGLEVLLLERAELATGASGRNQGLLLPGLETHGGSLFREAADGYLRLAAEGLVDFDLRSVGHLLLAADEATLASAKEQAGAMAAAGFAVEELDPEGLVALEPSLAPDLAGGFRSTDGYALDPASATLAWAEDARRAGAELRTWTSVRRLRLEGGRVTGVHTDAGPLTAGAVVVAAGPWTRALAAGAGVELPVSGARGWLLQTSPLPWSVAHAFQEATWPGEAEVGAEAGPPTVAELAADPAPAYDEGTAFTLQQRPTGAAVVGASLATSLREDPEHPETVRGLARRALRFVPELAGVPVVASWSGVRPITPDGDPLIGPVPGLPGLWVAAGHGPVGVVLAPSTGRMLADHLAGGRPAADAAPFDPARFPATNAAAGPDR
jgi:glycine/D-amino acid oxidase-like deaminating enzyme